MENILGTSSKQSNSTVAKQKIDSVELDNSSIVGNNKENKLKRYKVLKLANNVNNNDAVNKNLCRSNENFKFQ